MGFPSSIDERRPHTILRIDFAHRIALLHPIVYRNHNRDFIVPKWRSRDNADLSDQSNMTKIHAQYVVMVRPESRFFQFWCPLKQDRGSISFYRSLINSALSIVVALIFESKTINWMGSV
jgi:hypothetical protein